MTIEELVKQAVKEVVAAKLETEEERTEEEEEVEVAEAPVQLLQSSAKSGI